MCFEHVVGDRLVAAAAELSQLASAADAFKLLTSCDPRNRNLMRRHNVESNLVHLVAASSPVSSNTPNSYAQFITCASA
jgi:hypothetical protein